MDYRIRFDEEPKNCPKCGGEVSVLPGDVDWDYVNDFTKFTCDKCGFKFNSFWLRVFQRWEPDKS